MQAPEPSVVSSKPPFYRRWGHSSRIPAIPSVVASHASLQSNSLWSSGARREGKHIMHFASPWQAPLCPVTTWYQAQVNHTRDQGLTATFSVVQHRRTNESPFFHEYLIIPLSDGSSYRLERMGVGSRVNAVLLSGCEACDMIEWIPADKSMPHINAELSLLVAEVRFPRSFELLDLLAVCYAIQQHPRAKRYVLQTFNCYFFCCTILSILARRLVDLKLVASSREDGEQLERAFEEMERLCTNPLSDRATKYFPLRLCSAIAPQNSRPGLEIVQLLKISVQDEDVYHTLDASLRNVLWLNRSGRTIMEHISPHLRESLMELFTQLVETVPQRAELEGTEDYKAMERIFYREFGAALRNHFSAKREQGEAFLRRFYEVSLAKKCAARLFGVPFGFAVGFAGGCHLTHRRGFGQLRAGVSYGRSVAKVGHLMILHSGTADPFNIHYSNEFDSWDAWSDRIFGSEESLVLFLGGVPFQDLVTLLFSADEAPFVVQSSVFLLSDTLCAPLLADAMSLGEIIELFHMQGADRVQTRVDIFGFQDYIRQHTKGYADRVDTHRLDSASLVCLDVDKAIEAVWELLPFGFGPNIESR